MSYRVEVSPNNRAGCQDALCKKNGDKITKGEIRFGAFVEGTSSGGHDFSGFKWRHWGCVSGKTIANLRENLSREMADEGDYSWDYLDGLEEMPKDFQEKIKRAIIEGKIADEDWRGDPEYNVLGKTGIRGRAQKKVNLEDVEEGQNVNADAETPSKPPTKKRGRAKKDEDDDEEVKPAKKRAAKAKKGDDDDDDDDDDGQKPAKKTIAKKAAKKEEDSANNMKIDENNEEEVDVKPIKKPGAKKGTKRVEDVEPVKQENNLEANVKPAKKVRGNAAKKEPKEGTGIKEEVTDEVNVDTKPTKKPRSKKGPKKEEVNDDADIKKEEKEQAYNAEKPDDPLQQIANGFCDRDGPLVTEFNEWVAKDEIDDTDFDGFLQKKFQVMVKAGEVEGDDWNGFLQIMHDREVAALEPQDGVPKRARKGKNFTGTTAKPRGRKGKVS